MNEQTDRMVRLAEQAVRMAEEAKRGNVLAVEIRDTVAGIKAAGPPDPEPADLVSLLRKAAEMAERSASPPLLPSGLTIGQTAATAAAPEEKGAGDSATKKQKPLTGTENQDPNPKKVFSAARSYSKTGAQKPKPQAGRKDKSAGSGTSDSEAEDADSRFNRVALGSGKRSPSLELELKKPAGGKSEPKKRPVATEAAKKKPKVSAADWDF